MKVVIAAFATLMLAGCAPHEGRYAPDCVAFAGSIVTLEGGGFVWEKFTDEVRVDEQGNTIDPFPGYPLRGTYTLDDTAVLFESASGEQIDRLHLHRRGADHLLLTAAQQQAFERSGSLPDCPLRLGAGEP